MADAYVVRLWTEDQAPFRDAPAAGAASMCRRLYVGFEDSTMTPSRPRSARNEKGPHRGPLANIGPQLIAKPDPFAKPALDQPPISATAPAAVRPRASRTAVATWSTTRPNLATAAPRDMATHLSYWAPGDRGAI